MPPRYAYWTILVDDQPTAFRASSQEDLMPTFKRLKEKHATAKMMWWQNGKLWPSRLDAQEAMHARGEMGRRGDARQAGGFRDRKREQDRRPREERDASGKLEWKPKPKSDALAPRDHLLRRSVREDRPQWKPKTDRRPPKSEKLEWRPKQTGVTPERREPRRSAKREGAPSSPQKRDKTWRPGGEHRDPRQKYKDAKKAKWTRFKQTIRKRWESKQPGPRKRRDEE